MDCLIGIVGKDFTLVAADSSAARGVTVFKTDEDKILALDQFKLLAAAGPVGDRYNFTEYVQKNIHLHELRTDVRLSTKAAASWTRNELAKSIRSSPFQVNLLMAGYDKGTGPSLYFLDYMGSCHPMPIGAHGYGASLVLSTLDRGYVKNMSLDEAKELLKKCLHELDVRFLIHQPEWTIKTVSKEGVQTITL